MLVDITKALLNATTDEATDILTNNCDTIDDLIETIEETNPS